MNQRLWRALVSNLLRLYSVIRSYSQMAIMGGVCAALFSLPLAVGRAVGLIHFTPEFIPGLLLGAQIGYSLSGWENMLVYIFFGAFAGILYRFWFSLRGKTDLRFGFALGVVQWLSLGIFLALIEPSLPTSPLVLPAEAGNHSQYGLISFILILLLNISFGACMAILAPAPNGGAATSQTTEITKDFPEAA